MNAILALVVLYATFDALARRRPRRRSSGVVVDEEAPRRWMRLAVRAIGSAAVAAALAVGFSDGASAQSVDSAAAESVVVADSAAQPPVTPTDAPAASADPPASVPAAHSTSAASTAVDAPSATTPPAAAATSPAADPTPATTAPPATDPAAGAPTTDPAADAPATTPASGDAIPAGGAAAASAPPVSAQPAADATPPAAAPATDPTGAADAATGLADPAPAAGDAIAAAAVAAPAPEATLVAALAGTPGVPQPATVVLDEDFQNRPGPTPVVRLDDYTGTTGQTYTADAPWLTACNGWISSAGESPTAAAQVADCLGQTFWNESQQMSQALAIALGQSAADAQGNYALSAFTSNTPGAGLIEFQTATNIALLTPNRFITFSVDLAAVNCNQTHPSLQFFFLDAGGAPIAAGSLIDPCSSPATVFVPGIGVAGPAVVRVGTYTSDAVLINGASVGLRMVNNSGSGAGNDLALDNIQIFDVTPQLDKSFSSTAVGVGQTSTLTMTVTNTVELAAKNGWSFVDTLPAGLVVAGPAATTCPAGTVTALIGGSTVSVGGNLDAGAVSCMVTVPVTSSTTGSFTNGPSNFSDVVGMGLPNDATVTFTSEPALTIVKSSTTVTMPPVGQTIPYSFLVTNTGNVTMSAIAVSDPNTTGVSCPVTTLAPNASTTCTGAHTVVQADVDAGSVVNTASVVATPPVGTPIAPVPSNQVTILGTQLPALTIDKASTTTSITAAGQTVPYTFTVTNTGNVTITGVAVSDPKVGAVTCPATTLAPGSSTMCTGSYTATAADLDSGQAIVNTATATGTPPPNAPALAPATSNTVTVAVVQSPALTIDKSSTTTSATAVGQVIPYTFLVTNTGNVTMTSVAVNDPKVGNVTCPQTTIAAGASMTCTASYTLTPADVTAGRVVNTASVVGDPPSGTPITAMSNEVLITVALLPPTATLSGMGERAPVQLASPAARTALLPTTGGDAASMLRLAAILALLGGGLTMVSRRRKRIVS